MRAIKALLNRVIDAGITIETNKSFEDMTWEELLSIDPTVIHEAGAMLDYSVFTTIDSLDEVISPDLKMLDGEDDDMFELRMEKYIQYRFFPAVVRETGQKIVVCFNPFIPELDHVSDELVIVPYQVVLSVLKGTGFDSEIPILHESEPVDKWITRLIAWAYEEGSADLEITSHASSMRVRIHVMGEWSDWKGSIPLNKRGAIMRSLCNMAIPPQDYRANTMQDFKIERRISGVDTSWRVTSAPGALGVSVDMRMLPQIGKVPTLVDLGYFDQAIELIGRATEHRDGLILITGATGSGKSTCLYSILNGLKSQGKKIVSVEDPVELIMPGLIQMQLNEDETMDAVYKITFTSGARSAMRQKPDVLVIGEMRDQATAKAAISASRTGHLAISTLHVGSVSASSARLRDLGVQGTEITDYVRLVISQHLVRVLCPICKKKHSDGTATRNMNGCDKCKRGFKSKTVVYEMLYPDEQSRYDLGEEKKIKLHYERLAEKGLYLSFEDTMSQLYLQGKVDWRECQMALNDEQFLGLQRIVEKHKAVHKD